MHDGGRLGARRVLPLHELELFRDLSPDDLDAVRSAAQLRNVEKGRILFFPGDVSDTVWFVGSGRIKVSRLSESGKELILDILEPGQFFGEAGVLDERPRESLAEALESAALWVVDGSRFRALLATKPRVSMTLAKFLGRRQRRLEQRLLDVVTKNAQKRLADLLLQLGESYGVKDARGILLRIKLSQSALGNLLGVSREIVNHTFSDLRRRGVVEIAEGRVVIQDPKALAALAA